MTATVNKAGWKKVLRQILFCIIILAIGIFAAFQLILSREEPEVIERQELAPLVVAKTVHICDVPIVVRGHGTVQPKIQVDLVPEVSGKVVSVHPKLVDGGFFSAGEVLITIDPADYELAVERAKASVQRAKVKLELERAEGEVAKSEWESMNPGVPPPSPLIIRGPQIQQAEAELRAADADLKTAELSLRRTKISLPFSGRILSERVDVGQYVVPGQTISTVYSTAAVEIKLPLEDRELQWFALPSGPSQGNPDGLENSGVSATVIGQFAGASHQWQGRAVRSAGQVDPQSRMVFVVVEVNQPFAASEKETRPPLVPGMFVEVEISGTTLEQVIPLPRHALHQDQTVWVVEEGRLWIRPVKIARLDRDTVYVSEGLKDKALIVTSSLDTVTNGLRVQVPEKEKTNRNSGELKDSEDRERSAAQ